MPFAPSSFLFLVAMPGAPNSVLVTRFESFCLVVLFFGARRHRSHHVKTPANNLFKLFGEIVMYTFLFEAFIMGTRAFRRHQCLVDSSDFVEFHERGTRHRPMAEWKVKKKEEYSTDGNEKVKPLFVIHSSQMAETGARQLTREAYGHLARMGCAGIMSSGLLLLTLVLTVYGAAGRGCGSHVYASSDYTKDHDSKPMSCSHAMTKYLLRLV